jgi:hypothetical protein
MIRTAAAAVSLLSLMPQALATLPLDPRTHTILRADDVLHRSYDSLGISMRSASQFLFDTTLAELDLRGVDDDANGTDSSPASASSTSTATKSGSTSSTKSSPGSGSSSRSSSNGTATNWNAETDAACNSALTSMLQSNNPSGTALCYNLPSLDTSTGTFTADMRLYKVADASGSFEGVQLAEMHVMATFPYATVTMMSTPTNTGNESDSDGGKGARDVERRSTSPPMLLESYMLSGHINKSNMTSNMSM